MLKTEAREILDRRMRHTDSPWVFPSITDPSGGASTPSHTFDEATLAKIAAVTPINVPELFDAQGDKVVADIAVTQAAPAKLTARHPAGATGETATYEVLARNLCGPTRTFTEAITRAQPA